MLKRSNSYKVQKLTKFKDCNEYFSYNGDLNTRINRLQIDSVGFLSKLPDSERLRYFENGDRT